MKEEIRALVAAQSHDGRSFVREYLQARILHSLQTSGAMINVAFHGGTALRFLFRIPRYSEALDFSLARSAGYDFERLLRKVKAQFTSEGYEVEVRMKKNSSPVDSAFVRFPGLLHQIGISPHRDEVLAVKLDIDTNPPAGAQYATTLLTRHVTLNVHHHDSATLLAGKLNALITRSHVKGRDVYDLMWYLTQPEWPEPNLIYLNNALQQFRSDLLLDTAWRRYLSDHLSAMNWERVIEDVRPFLERQEEVEFLARENVLRLLN